MDARLQAGSATSDSVARTKSIRKKRGRDGINNTTFHYNAACTSFGGASVLSKRIREGPYVLRKERTPQECSNGVRRIDGFLAYHTRQAGLRTIGALGLQPKALAKSAEFETTPFTRYCGAECSFDNACRRMVSGVWLAHQICA